MYCHLSSCKLFLVFLHTDICNFLFFFFQAEDGIRDWSVTGVQTCALPIYAYRRPSASASSGRQAARAEGKRQEAKGKGQKLRRKTARLSSLTDESRAVCRSEERRVGKECRSGWSAYH